MSKGVIKVRSFQSGEPIIEPSDNKSISYHTIAEESKVYAENNMYRTVTFTLNSEGEAVIEEDAPESKL